MLMNTIIHVITLTNKGDHMSKIERYLSRRGVRQRYGISNMTLWRWEHDPRLNFPKPIEINGRKYFAEALIEVWERDRAIPGSSRELAR
jgi:predicted DNA-binding transcriptional regulator AlpA